MLHGGSHDGEMPDLHVIGNLIFSQLLGISKPTQLPPFTTTPATLH